MELPYDGEHKVLTRYHVLPSKVPSTRNGLHIFELLSKEAPQLLSIVTNYL